MPIKVLKHICFILLIGIVGYLLHHYEIYCIIRYVTGIACPTCGSTRALIQLFRLDISGYLYYNPMAIPAVMLFLLAIHSDTKLLKSLSKETKNRIFIVGGMIIFITYIIRL